MPPPRSGPSSRPSPTPSPGATRLPSRDSGRSLPGTARHAQAAILEPARQSPSPRRAYRPSRPGRPCATPSMHSERFPRDNFPTLVAPMTSYTHRRAPARDHGLVSDASTFPLHRIHLPSGYLRPDDRTHGHDVHGRSPNPFTACRSSSASARSRRGPGTFGAKRSLTAGTRRHHCCPVVRPSYPIPEKHGDTGHVRIRQINVLNRHLRLSPEPITDYRVPGFSHGAPVCARV